jgi:nitrogen regulatory protein PII
MARPCYVGHVRGSTSLARPAKKIVLVRTRLQQTSERDRLVAPMASSVLPIMGRPEAGRRPVPLIFIIDTTWLRKEKWYTMKTLIIVARDSMLSNLEELLQSNGVTAYTILNNVMGKGVTGRMYGTFLNPDINAIIFAVLPSDQADRAVSALKTFHATHKKPSHDDKPIPLKVFSFPCEEHI